MDQQTLDFYQNRSSEWAAALPHTYSPALDSFLDRLEPGARILELGCGDGRDAQRMMARGFSVHPSDGTPAMAALASDRLGIMVPVMQFEDLNAQEAFDAVWCHASLLHVEEADLPGVLGRIHRALKTGGWHFASFKSGSGGTRDEHGRFYSYISAPKLHAAYVAAARWPHIAFDSSQGASFGGKPTIWVAVTARK